MTTTKHTPGPLEVIGNLVRTTLNRGGMLVADCRDADGQPFTDEAKANALLFSVAHELLAALEAEQEWQDRDLAGAIDPEWDYEVMVGAKRRAAIAKATGSPTEQPEEDDQ